MLPAAYTNRRRVGSAHIASQHLATIRAGLRAAASLRLGFACTLLTAGRGSERWCQSPHVQQSRHLEADLTSGDTHAGLSPSRPNPFGSKVVLGHP